MEHSEHHPFDGRCLENCVNKNVEKKWWAAAKLYLQLDFPMMFWAVGQPQRSVYKHLDNVFNQRRSLFWLVLIFNRALTQHTFTYEFILRQCASSFCAHPTFPTRLNTRDTSQVSRHQMDGLYGQSFCRFDKSTRIGSGRFAVDGCHLASRHWNVAKWLAICRFECRHRQISLESVPCIW